MLSILNLSNNSVIMCVVQVARIVGADVDKPYDILGVNWKMSAENIKKRLETLFNIHAFFNVLNEKFFQMYLLSLSCFLHL